MKSSEGEQMAAGIAALPITAGLSQLFGEHHRRVLTAAYRITGNMADAEDAQGPMTNAGSYLYRAAINGALDLLRSRKAASTEPLEGAAEIASKGPGSSPEEEVSGRELGEFLRLAIAELAPRAAEMFTLRYLEELGNREIAALMGTSQAVVAVTLYNARSRLKKRLSELEWGRR
jgi:RNA polymerase sigma-70 factor (ECF subfamily)